MSHRPLCSPVSGPVLALAIVLAAAAVAVRAGAVRDQPGSPTLEYIAHASFVVESPGGRRVAIDPFNSERWLGYTFPEGVRADAVLVSHPHYDHDASYYFPADTPVFRRPGRYTIGDVTVEGIAGRHANPYGMDFGQINTVWVVETGGVRIAHLGDNGPLSPAVVSALGRIDVLLVPADGQQHILTFTQIAEIRAQLRPRVTVPMHYRLEGFLDLPASLDPLAASALPRSRQVANHRLTLDAATLGAADATLLLQPMPGIRPWSAALADAWQQRNEARAAVSASGRDDWRRALPGLRAATTLAPAVIAFQFELAEVLHRLGKGDEALAIVERAVSASGQQDAEYTMRARGLLGELYAARGLSELAAAQYALIVRDSPRPALVEPARAFLSAR